MVYLILAFVPLACWFACRVYEGMKIVEEQLEDY